MPKAEGGRAGNPPQSLRDSSPAERGERRFDDDGFDY